MGGPGSVSYTHLDVYKRQVFLGAHRPGFAGVGVEQHGCLLDRPAILDLLDLPADLVIDRLLHELEAVQILDFAPRAQRCARPAHGLSLIHI